MDKIVNEIQNLQNIENKLFNELNLLMIKDNDKYKYIGKYDAPYNDLGATYNSSHAKCKESCDSNKRCVGIVFDNRNDVCYPKLDITKKYNHPNLSLYSKIDNTEEKQKIINKINNLSNIRVTLLKSINGNYNDIALDVSKTKEEYNNQLNLTKMTEIKLNEMKTNINNLLMDKNKKIRKVEINTYESDKYDSYLKLTNIIIVFCVVFVVLGILSKYSKLPSNIINIIVSVLLIILTIIIVLKLFDISSRNNMNFNEYDTYRTSSDSSTPIIGENLSDKKNKLFNMGTCIGQGCCSAGTKYDNKLHKCIDV